MATMSQTQMETYVTEALGIVAPGVSASTADANTISTAVVAVFNRLRKLGLAPFPISAIPEWAQIEMRDLASYDAASSFGIVGERLMDLMRRASMAEKELGRQVAGYRHPIPIKARYF